MSDDMQRFTVERDGDLDITFRGRLVGQGEHGTGGSSGYACDWNRGVTVCVYLTAGGSIVTAVHRWSRWQGEGDLYAAEVHQTAAAALAWLVEDAGGELGPASKAAWTQASKAKPEVFRAAVEVA